MEIIRDETVPTDDRNDAIWLLAKAEQPEEVADLLLTLLDDEPVRSKAVEVLPKLKAKADLGGSLLRDKLSEVGAHQPQFAKILLYTLLRSDLAPGRATSIYMHLAYLDLSVFSHRLETPEASVARKAYKNLKPLFDSKESLEASLIGKLRTASDWRIRASAVAGLNKQERLPDQAIDPLTTAPNDPNAWVRFYPAVTLTEKNVFSPVALEAWFDGIADRPLPTEQRTDAIYHTAVVVRPHMGSRDPVKALTAMLADPQAMVRVAVQ